MRFINRHLEWFVFSLGILLLALMNPENSGTSFCLFELAGIDFCPGDGLGHSISYTFRGELKEAFQAHFAGPIALLILTSRIVYIWRNLINEHFNTKEEQNG